MAKLINADKANIQDIACTYGCKTDLYCVEEWFNALPAVEAVEVVHADWKDCENADFVYCTNCKKEWNVFDNRAELFYYCPNCGAKMNGGKNE